MVRKFFQKRSKNRSLALHGLEACREIAAKRAGAVRADTVSESSGVQVRLAEFDADVKTACLLLE